ncbi:MAG: nitroreductase family protein [Bacteroidetes bacterium]|nr:nitroreductase family protein [Bacteroidota bacterium]
MNSSNPGFLDIIFQRKSVRHFVEKPVSKDDLMIMVKAGMAAPSARNEQPWAFIVLTDRYMLNQLGEGLPYAKMLYFAGAAFIVCGDTSIIIEEGKAGLWQQDCAAATENILLAAESLNLGAVWTAVHPYIKRESHVRNILHLPDHIIPFCVIPVGYPTGEDVPKDKFDSRKIHWGKW